MTLISLLVVLILVGLAFWAVRELSGSFGIPAPIVKVIQVLLVVLVVLWILRAVGVGDLELRF